MIFRFCVFAFGTVWASLGRRCGLAQTAPPAKQSLARGRPDANTITQTQTGPHKNTKRHTPGAGRGRAVVGHCVAWVRVIRNSYSFRNQAFKQPLRSNLPVHPNILFVRHPACHPTGWCFSCGFPASEMAHAVGSSVGRILAAVNCCVYLFGPSSA